MCGRVGVFDDPEHDPDGLPKTLPRATRRRPRAVSGASKTPPPATPEVWYAIGGYLRHRLLAERSALRACHRPPSPGRSAATLSHSGERVFSTARRAGF
jgi:hypothetical protein